MNISPLYLEINGIRISGECIPHLVATITNPDPTKWFRFERKAGSDGQDVIIVHTKRDD